ncbi:malate synthase [Priestia megaterium]|uniref:malate synthase n=1 Tax=Priestia megaterium TaxID=1404 RepID=UPI0013E3C1F3|nr:malate synthase [Priestia megaterium]MED3867182.1 malate synthase [Priestia megaterium]MED4102791.1 malate synthase [Priestia megaterium]MED4147126.1 malate synthase [Priestia megaterium]MED4170779.1 malate synthase [Priestia megaterium]MED4202216.1 malate synthase [Priestia megaterium]
MNLINKKVTHKLFGIGSIVKYNDSSIEIHFASENKKFVFPDVFGKHLKLHDKSVADLLGKIIEKKEMEHNEKERKKEEEKKLQRKNQELRWGLEKLMKNHKLHSESQMVFWCDTEEQNSSFLEWKVFSGVIKSGNNKGKPTKPIRLHQNSAVLLTAIDSSMPEKDRRILGVYMVNEDFIGKLCEDGYIPAHSKYRLQLTEQESDQMLFWEYYINERSSQKMTWNTGKYRYFNNLWMAQILLDIVDLKSDPKERELAQQFFEHFCKMNLITAEELPKPSGALMRM